MTYRESADFLAQADVALLLEASMETGVFCPRSLQITFRPVFLFSRFLQSTGVSLVLSMSSRVAGWWDNRLRRSVRV